LFGKPRRHGKHAIDPIPDPPLNPRIVTACFQRSVFAMHDEWNTRESGGDQTLAQRRPAMCVHHVRSLTLEQPVQLSHQHRIVPLSTIQLEELYPRLQALFERVPWTATADTADDT
jgi:hypothetical protein